LSYLPVTFEWTLASLPLAAIGIVVGGWGWLLALPLLITWALCLKGALSAKIDSRFEGVKARALIAALIYLGPLLRGFERLKWRLKALPPYSAQSAALVEQRAHLVWRELGFVLSYWNEGGAEKEEMIGALMRQANAARCPPAIETGWSVDDLAVTGGVAARAHIALAVENHGADKRLIRVRSSLSVSRLARWIVGGLGLIALAGVAVGPTGLAATFAALALATIGAAGWRLVVFAGRLHRIVEAAASEIGLIPVEPLARVRLAAVGRTHTA